MSNIFKNKFLFLVAFTIINCTVLAQSNKKRDTTLVKKDTINLRYNFKRTQTGSLFLDYLSTKEIVFDKALNKYEIVEKIGNYSMRTPIFLTPKEYADYRLKRDMTQYFKEKISATNGKKKGSKKAQKNLLPTYYVNSDFFKTIFGGNTIDFVPSGNLSLKLGFIYQNTDNPQVSEENRSNFNFDFDQQINASIRARVGERLEFTANYDTQASFDFQNLANIEYTSTEDDILQGIEAGNVSMPIKNSLISGAQSLFGVKANLKFGNTDLTAIFSQQNSESKTVTSEGGASVKAFSLRTTDYDDDRHFFLSQYFIDNYANSLKNIPLVNSQINITRIEVWVTNRNSDVRDFRNIVALADLGEANVDVLVNRTGSIQPTNPPSTSGGNIPTNNSNNLSELLTGTNGIRDISTVNSTLQPYNMSEGIDYSILENARKLGASEYTLNPQLGYISLNRRLNDGEVLAVSYEYTVAGGVTGTSSTSFKVGEFSNDGIENSKNLVVKLLRSEILTTKRDDGNGGEESFPTWRLMMKNVYSLSTYSLSQEGFQLEIQYRDDQTGITSNVLQNAKTEGISNIPLLQVFKLDQLDQSNYREADGFFDFIEGITVISKNGHIFFPEPEPFGNNLIKNLSNPKGLDENLDKEYLFKELYLNTKINIKNNFQNKDKYFLKGYYTSDDSEGISIGAFNVPRGSVTVTAGGKPLLEGIDYVVNYQLGRVQIIDPALKASNIPVQVTAENNAVFNQQRKTYMGVDIQHKFSEDFIIGTTLLNVNERPLTPKINYGSDPVSNTMLGLNLDYSSEVPYLTKLVNKLPFVNSEEASNLSVRADMAYLLPGTPKGIDVAGSETTYIDDFEASQIPISLLSPFDWYHASTPKFFPIFNGDKNDLSYNYQRARIAWYSIDQIFYGVGDTPSNIDTNELSRAETRQVDYSELFPNVQLDVTQNSLISTLNLAYFPSERGAYNFDTNNNNVNNDGTFSDPENRWGGIMRPLLTNNFDQANVEYIQFWVMDPYKNYSITSEEGLPNNIDPNIPSNQVGDLYINLGNISEDILKDNRKMYENGLSESGGNVNREETIWGSIPTNPSIIYAFSEDDNARTNQDVGFDGLKNDEELSFYETKYPLIDFSKLDQNDVSSDNFQFFRGSELDANNASIITRYKKFNNTEGNSPTLNQSTEPYSTSSTTNPDVEDINKDQTMNTVESYYEYKVSLNSTDLVKGKNYIVDTKTTEVTLQNGQKQETIWHQFRVPIRSGTPINGISNFNSIRFVRMFLTNFKMPVVVRFGELDLVRGDWRRYTKTLDPNIKVVSDLTQDEIENFEIGVVNIEQNEGRYLPPPGIERERLQGGTIVQLQNEQSVSLKVTDLPTNKIRAIYKNINIDLRRFKNLRMFMHLEEASGSNINDDDFSAIIRLGTDLEDNFYQIELPLKVSRNSSTETDIWPTENDLNAFLKTFGLIKLERDESKIPLNELYTSVEQSDDLPYKISVKGSPTLAQLRTVLLGIKNNSTLPLSGEIWFNELRSSDFDNKGGWAATVNADANFSDVANVSLSGSISTVGFGGVEDKVVERNLNETKQYDITTSISLGKVLTPEKWRLQIPMNYSIGETYIDPKYDPKYQDVELKDALERNENSEFSRDYTKRTSISFINVKKGKNPNTTRKPKFYDIENIALSYSYNKEFQRSYNIKKRLTQNVSMSATYNFKFQSKEIEPFKKSSWFKGKYLALIKDFNFNPLPNSLVLNYKINRSYFEQQSRNLVSGLADQPTLKQRKFLLDWDYTVGFNLTKSLQLNFNATNSHIYDTFDNDSDIQIFDDFFNPGRVNHYHHKLNGTYSIPINKIPALDFLQTDYSYTADFDWQAAPQNLVETNGESIPSLELVGNTVQNANTHNLNFTLNFSKLYSKFYKDLGLENWLKTKREKLETSEIEEDGKKYKRVPYKKNKTPFSKKVIKLVYELITSVKQGKLSVSENNGQILPGYTEDAGFLGGATGFAFGSQVDMRNVALENNWFVRRKPEYDYYTKTYNKTKYNKLDYNFTLTPIKNLNIDVRGNKIKTTEISQQLDLLEGSTVFENTPNFETGNFSTSFSMIKTAFANSDVLFQKLKDYRSIILKRLADENNLPPSVSFGENSQQVLIPAFIAAYSGKDPLKVNTGLFRNIPIPNWTLTYNGLMNLKFFKKNFSIFVISHGYKSSYTISNFTNNLQRDPNDITSPSILASSITLVEELSPLFKIDLKMRSPFSLRGEIKKDRTLTMNLNNNTLTDLKGTEYIFGLGYIFKNVKFSTRFTGKKQTLRGDINLRADISIKNTLAQIRSIDENNNQINGGQNLLSIKFAADYRLSNNLSASFYYNHQTFKYAISTTFPRQTINGGFNIIYNLGGN